MQPLRPFLLVSDTIEYTADFADQFTFPKPINGTARCAVIGMVGRITGDAAATIGSWGTLVEAINVAGRRYVQGQIPFGLLSSAAPNVTGASTQVMGRTSYFPGSFIPLPCGGLGSGIPLSPGDVVRMSLRRRSSTAYVNQVALVCVQFPNDPGDPLNAIWRALRLEGLGEVSFIGHVTSWLGAGLQTTFEGLVQPQNAQVVRRVGLRGVVTNNLGLADAFEYGTVAALTMNNLLVQLRTSNNRPPQNQRAPARAILGLPGYDPQALGLVDMALSERAQVEVQFAGTAAASATQFVHVLDMFEGRQGNAPALTTADAVS